MVTYFMLTVKSRWFMVKLSVVLGTPKFSMNGVASKLVLGLHYKNAACHYTFDAMQNNFLEENFTLHTKQTDKQQCTEIETAPNEATKHELVTSIKNDRY